MKFILVILSLFILGLSSYSQSIKIIIVDEKGNTLNGVKIEESTKQGKERYDLVYYKKSFEISLDQKYKFLKAGYYPNNYKITKWEYDNSPEDFKGVLKVQLERYVVHKHKITDEFGRPVSNALILYNGKKIHSDTKGIFNLPKLNSADIVRVKKDGYFERAITYDKAAKTRNISISKISSDKCQIKGLVTYSDGQPVRNAPVYIFQGSKFIKDSKSTKYIGLTSSKGEFDIIYNYSKREENLGVYFNEKIKDGHVTAEFAFKPIRRNKSLQKINLSILKARIVKKKSTKTKKNESAVHKLPEVKKNKDVVKHAVSSEEIIVEEHLDTIQFSTTESKENVEEYVSYLELLADQNDLVNEKKTKSLLKGGQIKKEIKSELIELKKSIEKKEIEIEEEEVKKIALWVIIAIILVIIIPGIVLYLSLKNQKKIVKLNTMLEESNNQIEEAYLRIRKGIEYAQRIQDSILMKPETIAKSFADLFILYRPKDVVSGDFYWFGEIEGKSIIIAVDCTGHGVPGACMTLLGNSFLNEIIKVNKITSPKLIMERLNQKIVNALSQGENQLNDGMDLSIISVDRKNEKLIFGGANNPLIYFKNEELIELKGSRKGIGGQLRTSKKRKKPRKEIPYEEHELNLKDVEQLYLFSDGYVDQFGGDGEDKFLKSTLKELLHKHQRSILKDQQLVLDVSIDKWMGETPQTDDMLVVGVKL